MVPILLIFAFKVITTHCFESKDADDIGRSFAVDDAGYLHYVSYWQPSSLARDEKVNHHVEFKIYNRDERNGTRILPRNATTLRMSLFNESHPTWIMIHGWLGSSDNEHLNRMKNTILERQEANIILVDWSATASVSYYYARWGMTLISVKLGELIALLQAHDHCTSKITLIGFSLGAHMAGLAAKSVRGGFLGSIVGLDPASVLFKSSDLDGRLDKSDAPYVEVVHSNGGLAGYLSPMGHVDFYVNGGILQPNCGNKLFYCAHTKSMEIYERSLRDEIVGQRCIKLKDALHGACSASEVTRMGGLDEKKWHEGIYYVKG